MIPEEGIMMENRLLDTFPGISCAWTDANNRITTACYGVSDKDSGLPVDENTIFPACSISKFITAICVLKLQEQGLIDIDVPVNAYLRKWKLHTLKDRESDAAIRTLLCHTAGIVDGEDSFYGQRREDPEITLPDILKGTTSYNSRPVRAEKPQGTTFEYSDAGYCVLQLMIEEATCKNFADAAKDIVFDPLSLQRTFFASPENISYFENNQTMATGYDGDGLPIPGRFPLCPDLAASGLWTTPKELLVIARAFIAALKGRSTFLTAASAQEMAAPIAQFPWTGLGLFISSPDILLSQGWGENGQCMMKMNLHTGEISVVMTNRNPETDQAASGVEWLTDRNMNASA